MKSDIWRKPLTVYLTAFLVPVLICSLIYIFSDVYPFGDECFLKTDMYHQYAPFYSELRYKLTGGGSFYYSWNMGLGMNFVALFAYYLASPFNFLIALSPQNLVIEFMMLIMLIRLGLSSVSMCFFLRKRGGEDSPVPALFGIVYALSGFMCAYYWNLMWIECVALLPLILYGFEKLLRGEGTSLYIFSLGYCIFTNFYISIMICISLVLFFIASMVMDPPKGIRPFLLKCLNFAAGSLLAGAIAAVLLLPEFYALRNSTAADSEFPKKVTQYFSILEMLSRHLPGVATEQALDHWPNIFSSCAVFIIFPLYLMNREISLKEKIVHVVLLVFFLMSFSLNVLNYIWHGLHYPNSLPARQSFVYVFLLLGMCWRLYLHRQASDLRQLGIALAVGAVFILYAQSTVKNDDFAFWVFYAGLFFTAVYAGLFYLEKQGKLKHSTLLLLALLTVAAETGCNTASTSMTHTGRTGYVSDNEDIRRLRDSLKPDSRFYRFEMVNRRTKNDGAWLNFPSVSVFSSLAPKAGSDFMRYMGCEASVNAYSITGSTPFVNMLLDVGYAFYHDAQTDGEGMRFVDSSGEVYLYENNYTLPLGFAMPKEMREKWKYDAADPAQAQNSLCDALSTDPVLVPNKGEEEVKNNTKFKAVIGEDGEYYAYISNRSVESVTVEWPDRKKTIEKINRGYFVELGNLKKKDQITITSETSGKNIKVDLYRFDYKALKKLYNKLIAGGFATTQVTDDTVTGTIRMDKSCVDDTGHGEVFFSIPFDYGWTATVDGEEAEVHKVFGTFISLSVPEGEHTVVLDYMPPGFWYGSAISLTGLFLALLVWYLERRNERAFKTVSAGAGSKTEETEQGNKTAETAE